MRPKRNPVAETIRDPKYRKRVVRLKTAYTRKGRNKEKDA